MAKRVNPRHGSMQFWPRKRATRPYARVRSVPSTKDAKLLAFAGYKVGMTHVIATDNGKNSMTKGEKISVPVTVIECPPLKISSVRFYSASGYGSNVVKEFFFKVDKEFVRKSIVSKSISKVEDLDSVDLASIIDITVQVYTQPHLCGVGKKTPEVFEIPLGGDVSSKLAFVKEHVGKSFAVSDAFKELDFVDTRAITKGKGFQGPVKRFGVSIRSHKSEKTIRGPGSLGAWIAQGHTMYRIAFAGQMGYHQRTQYGNHLLTISDDIAKVNPDGGFLKYGLVKTTYVLIKGSVPGAKKRLVMLTKAIRNAQQTKVPVVDTIITQSKQGN